MSLETFIKNLQEGDFTSSIEVLKAELKESSVEKIAEKHQEILESYGFKVDEKKKYMKEEDDEKDMDDDDDKEEKDDDEKDDD